MTTAPRRRSLRGSSTVSALLAVLVGLLLAPVAHAEELTLPSGFRDTTVWSGLEYPTNIRFAPNGQIFVAEKSGTILLYNSLQDQIPEVFAELSKAVYDKGDRGLLGLALDPQFPAQPYVYALYTFDHVMYEQQPGEFPRWGSLEHPKGDPCPLPTGSGAPPEVDACPVSGRLVRLEAQIVEREGRQLAAKAIEAGGEAKQKVLLEDWCQQDSTHSIGDLQFGPEGALYVSGGEGAGYVSPDYGQIGWPHVNPCADPPTPFGVAPPNAEVAEGGSLRAQDVMTPENPITHEDPTTLDGSVLRIDPKTGAAWPTNPLAGSSDLNARRIIATGFRNPFRFALDPSGKHLYVDNVGSSEYEEIDQIPTDAAQIYNSGWPCIEGPEQQFLWKLKHNKVCERIYHGEVPVSAPLFDYSHNSEVVPGDQCPHNSGSALTGNAIYTGTSFPPGYAGALFFADSVRGCIWVMNAGENGTPAPSTARLFGSGATGLYQGTDIEVGPEGNLYYSQMLGSGFGPGSIHRISYDPGAPTARLQADRSSGPLNLTVNFDASKSTDPEDEELEYEWDFGNGGWVSGSAHETHLFTEAKNYAVQTRVSDEDPSSADSIARLTIYAGDEPPTVEILKPTAGLPWQVGQTIDFAGQARNSEGHDIRYTHLYWDARILHCPTSPDHCHEHPLETFPAVSSGAFVAPDHDFPSYIRLILTATDERGLAATSSVELPAIGVHLRLVSNPPGIPLVAGEDTAAAPFTAAVIQGSHPTIEAPQSVDLGGKRYTFKSWSDGGAATHTIDAIEDGEYVAEYGSGSAAGTGGGRGSGPVSGSSPTSTPAPTVSLGPGPQLGSHPAKETRSRAARFAFSAKISGSSFKCRLDSGAWLPCRSPRTYKHLKLGKHVFMVRAVDARGAPVSNARVFHWQIVPAHRARASHLRR